MSGYLAALEIHPTTSSLGYPFPWNTPFRGRPIILETLEAIARCPSIDRVVLVVPEEENGLRDQVLSVSKLANLPPRKKVVVHSASGGGIIRRDRIPEKRRFAPSAWRAGWAIPLAVAERGDPRRLAAVAEDMAAGELVLFPPAAPFVVPELVEDLLEGRVKEPGARVRLSTLPPGVAGDIVSASYLQELVKLNLPLDQPLRFQPDSPERDLDTKGVFHWFSQDKTAISHRLTAESRRGLRVLESLDSWRKRHADGSREGTGWLRDLGRAADRGSIFSGPVPSEVRFKITNRIRHRSLLDPPVDDTSREDMDSELFLRIVAELAGWQDVRFVITGGEPLLHPDLGSLLRGARSRGAETLILETDGIGIGPLEGKTLAECVDLVIVQLDATTRDTYEALRGRDRLEEAEGGVRTLLECSRETGRPFVAVEFREVEENCQEIEEFFDRWFPLTPWVLLSPFGDRAGQLPGKRLHPYKIPERIPCIRLEETLVIFPGGKAALCENDFRLLEPVGDLRENTVEEVWRGSKLSSVRAAHASGEWGSLTLCRSCQDWCRRG